MHVTKCSAYFLFSALCHTLKLSQYKAGVTEKYHSAKARDAVFIPFYKSTHHTRFGNSFRLSVCRLERGRDRERLELSEPNGKWTWDCLCVVAEYKAVSYRSKLLPVVFFHNLHFFFLSHSKHDGTLLIPHNKCIRCIPPNHPHMHMHTHTKATECKNRILTHIFVVLCVGKIKAEIAYTHFSAETVVLYTRNMFVKAPSKLLVWYCFPSCIFSPTLLRIVVNEYNYECECKMPKKTFTETNFSWHFSF